MAFKTQADILSALVSGKKVKHVNWRKEFFILLKDGFLVDEDNRKYEHLPHNPSDWTIVEEPKPPRKLYAWRFGNDRQSIAFTTSHSIPTWWTDANQDVERAQEYDIEYKD